MGEIKKAKLDNKVSYLLALWGEVISSASDQLWRNGWWRM